MIFLDVRTFWFMQENPQTQYATNLVRWMYIYEHIKRQSLQKKETKKILHYIRANIPTMNGQRQMTLEITWLREQYVRSLSLDRFLNFLQYVEE